MCQPLYSINPPLLIGVGGLTKGDFMEDYYHDGFNVGYGQSHRNMGHDYPHSTLDRWSYEDGIRDGERRRNISRELDREGY